MEEARRRRWYGYGFTPGHETLVERRIRLAQERGEFDDLPGKGKPIPGIEGPDDELWWVRSYLRREGLSSEPLLPTPLQLRREAERLPETVRGLPSEREVRDVVAELNRRTAAWLRAPEGPHVPVRLADPDAVVAGWRAGRAEAAEPRRAERAALTPARPRRRWWWPVRGRAR